MTRGGKFTLWIRTRGARNPPNRLNNRALGRLRESPLPRPGDYPRDYHRDCLRRCLGRCLTGYLGINLHRGFRGCRSGCLRSRSPHCSAGYLQSNFRHCSRGCSPVSLPGSSRESFRRCSGHSLGRSLAGCSLRSLFDSSWLRVTRHQRRTRPLRRRRGDTNLQLVLPNQCAGQRASHFLHFSTMGRILCIDYGERHTGVAVSDPTRTIAQARPTIHHATESELLEALKRLVVEQEVDEIVIGLPVSRSGKPSRGPSRFEVSLDN